MGANDGMTERSAASTAPCLMRVPRSRTWSQELCTRRGRDEGKEAGEIEARQAREASQGAASSRSTAAPPRISAAISMMSIQPQAKAASCDSTVPYRPDSHGDSRDSATDTHTRLDSDSCAARTASNSDPPCGEVQRAEQQSSPTMPFQPVHPD